MDVEFVANDYFFVYAKVADHTLALEPISRVQLPPGKHTVYTRERLNDDWRPAAEIELELGNHYRVDMLDPTGVLLSTRD